MKEKKSPRRKTVLRTFLSQLVVDPQTGALAWCPRKRPKEPPVAPDEPDPERPEFDDLTFPPKPSE